MLLHLLRDAFHVFRGLCVVVLVASCFPGCFICVQLPSLRQAKLDRAQKVDLPHLAKAIDAYRQCEGVFPAKLEHLQAAGFIDRLPVDPWDTPYRYERTPRGMRVWSLGPDGREDGAPVPAPREGAELARAMGPSWSHTETDDDLECRLDFGDSANPERCQW